MRFRHAVVSAVLGASLVGTALVLNAQQADGPPPSQNAAPPTFTVHAQLVNPPVVVRDKNGALVTALKNGWLSGSQYSTAARRGWLALANKTNSSGQLASVCPGTGAAPAGTLASQQQFYASIALVTGDLHGQAPLLWTASELLQPNCPGVP